VIPDLDILERRVAAMRDIPWPIPALVIIEMTSQELTQLDAAADTLHYRSVLVAILKRIASDRRKATR
jgi:phage FluMu protein gp41